MATASSNRWITLGYLPSGYLTVCHGKSPFLIGKPFINGPFSMAMLNNQRVILWGCVGGHLTLISGQTNASFLTFKSQSGAANLPLSGWNTRGWIHHFGSFFLAKSFIFLAETNCLLVTSPCLPLKTPISPLSHIINLNFTVSLKHIKPAFLSKFLIIFPVKTAFFVHWVPSFLVKTLGLVQVLGLPPGTRDEDQIRGAFRRLAKARSLRSYCM